MNMPDIDMLFQLKKNALSYIRLSINTDIDLYHLRHLNKDNVLVVDIPSKYKKYPSAHHSHLSKNQKDKDPYKLSNYQQILSYTSISSK